MRESGVLLSITSLPSRYGIGCFSKEAYQFVDFLKKAGQTYWQILPLGQTGYGDSPYQSFSTFAGNPYFIDLEKLIKAGYLKRSECDRADLGSDATKVDYEKQFFNRYELLYLAYERSDIGKDHKFAKFRAENAYWIEDYALYMAIKKEHDNVSWEFWEEDLRLRKPEILDEYREKLKKEVNFYIFLQYLFFEQWYALKNYANKKGIRIIGDIPIYVAFDSADSWSHPELFQFDENRMPTKVAGCPPDGFSADGQLWGNPLYRWDYHKKTGYEWWIKRIAACYQLYDVIRIDHFRGFDEYYAIPYGSKNAVNGEWEKGPGMDLFEAIKKNISEDAQIIAEDLGFMTDTVRKLVKDSGFPNMKVLQFGFDSREDSDYMPHTFDKNCVVYTGTHDNDTVLGWYEKLEKNDKKLAKDYLRLAGVKKKDIPWEFIRLAMMSVANTCIIPMQDYLALGDTARMNIPSTLGGNWQWRMKKNAISADLAKRIMTLTKLSARLPKKKSTVK